MNFYRTLMSEHYGHGIEKGFERFGLIKTDYSKKQDYWALRSWTNTLEKMQIDCDIVFYGNSITAGSDFQSIFQDKKIINLGYSGDNIRGMTNRTEMVRVVKPEKIFIMAGINDLSNISVDDFVLQYDTMLALLRRENPSAKIYIQSILPVNHKINTEYKASNQKIIEANKHLQMIATRDKLVFINLYDLYEIDNELNKEYTSDGIHLKKEAYSVWASAIKRYIYE